MKKIKIISIILTLIVASTGLVFAYRDQYLNEIGVDFNLAPDNNGEMNYLPLKPIGEYYDLSISVDGRDISGYYRNKQFQLKTGSRIATVHKKREIYDEPVIEVNGHILVPRPFLEDLLKIDFKWKEDVHITPTVKTTPEDLKVYLYTNKDEYDFNEQVKVTMVIKNTGESKVKIPLTSSQIYDPTLSYQGYEIWRWSKGRMFTAAMTYFKLEPHETKVYNIKLPKSLILTPGRYQLKGTFVSKPKVVSDTFTFEIDD